MAARNRRESPLDLSLTVSLVDVPSDPVIVYRHSA